MFGLSPRTIQKCMNIDMERKSDPKLYCDILRLIDEGMSIDKAHNEFVRRKSKPAEAAPPAGSVVPFVPARTADNPIAATPLHAVDEEESTAAELDHWFAGLTNALEDLGNQLHNFSVCFKQPPPMYVLPDNLDYLLGRAKLWLSQLEVQVENFRQSRRQIEQSS